MKRALVLTGNLVQDHEYIYPYYRLKEEGFEVTTALKDAKACLGILGTNIPSDRDAKIISYEEMRIEDFDILVIPGGAKCMEKLRQEKGVLNFIKEFNDAGKVISSICHGAQLLISAKIVNGRRISGYYSIMDDISNSGAEYVDAPYVTDNNIISCPHYKYLGDWMKETFNVFNKKNDPESSKF
ncbi:DJ-1/PfpI/YhbO family deglycase/protease [Candidatus Pacearchaeota archaeon]|nr:DJ-1/PfpI/YhbO family deglycase/protease [Candidatus Pacearchaeota archaeon]